MSIWQKIQSALFKRPLGRPKWDAMGGDATRLDGEMTRKANLEKEEAMYRAARKHLLRDPFRPHRRTATKRKKMARKQRKRRRRRYKKIKGMRRRRKRKNRRGLFRRIFRSRNGWQKFVARRTLHLKYFHDRFVRPIYRPIKIASAVFLLPMPFFVFRAWLTPDQMFPDPRTTEGMYAGGMFSKAPPPAWGSAYALQYLKRNEIPKPPVLS